MATSSDTPIKITELQVLKSGAGYYIGRLCWNTENGEDYGFWEPFSRESGYYPTPGAAQDALTDGFTLRDCDENWYAFIAGTLPTRPGGFYKRE